MSIFFKVLSCWLGSYSTHKHEKHPNLSLKTNFKRDSWEKKSKNSENFDKLINIHKYANELISIFFHIFKINPLAFDWDQNWVNRSFFNDSTAIWKMSVEFEKKLAAILDFDNPARPTGLKKWVMVDPVWGHLKEHFCQVWCFYQILHTSVENLQLEPPLHTLFPILN